MFNEAVVPVSPIVPVAGQLPQTGFGNNFARMIVMMGAAIFTAFASIMAIKREKLGWVRGVNSKIM